MTEQGNHTAPDVKLTDEEWQRRHGKQFTAADTAKEYEKQRQEWGACLSRVEKGTSPPEQCQSYPKPSLEVFIQRAIDSARPEPSASVTEIAAKAALAWWHSPDQAKSSAGPRVNWAVAQESLIAIILAACMKAGLSRDAAWMAQLEDTQAKLADAERERDEAREAIEKDEAYWKVAFGMDALKAEVERLTGVATAIVRAEEADRLRVERTGSPWVSSIQSISIDGASLVDCAKAALKPREPGTTKKEQTNE